MIFQEFEARFKPMITKFGTQTYDAITVEEIWKTVQPLRESQFESIVREFIGENKRAKVSEFKEATMFWFRHRQQGGDFQDCDRCLGGWITADDKDTGYSFGFRCPSCLAGQALSESIPKWDDGLLMKYTRRV